MTRSVSRLIAKVMACVLLLAQLDVAAYACPGVAPAAKAIEASSNAPDAQSLAGDLQPGCDGAMGAMDWAMDPSSPNLCAEHCKYGQQSDHASTLVVPAAVLTALYAAPLVLQAPPSPRPAAASISALVAASPPHAIAHCVFRI